MIEKDVLELFLKKDLTNTLKVFNEFKNLPNATFHNDGKNSYIYVPGKRIDRVLLVAHADTVWDNEYDISIIKTRKPPFKFDGIKYTSNLNDRGLGADDRAGIAMLYLLKDSGHSLLILDGEEKGLKGARNIKQNNKDLFNEINNHNYILEFDRRNSTDYKCYNIPVTKKFRKFIETNTGLSDAGFNASTDICILSDKICAANLSVGYYNEHTVNEYLVFEEWYNLFKSYEELLAKKQDKYWLGKWSK